jgi:molybdenum cofactor biosynthesis enzyme MoaA
VGTKPAAINWRNFETGCRYAKDNHVSTVLLTGKGEPTLFPDQITAFLQRLEPFHFPFQELQTNGIRLAQEEAVLGKALRTWRRLRLSTIAVSLVHYEAEKNRAVFTPERKGYYDLAQLVARLHHHGFSVRLTCTMLKGYIDGVKALLNLVRFARENRVEQLTVRPVNQPAHSRDPVAAEWVRGHRLTRDQEKAIAAFLERKAMTLMDLPHGARVYDLDGQNVSLANSLTLQPRSGNIRQLIFFPDGHLRYDWQYQGAVLL